MARIDDGVQRPGRRPQASLDFPLHIKVSNNPAQTVAVLDGQPIGLVKYMGFQSQTDAKTGESKQKLILHVYDREDQTLSAALVDRLHEMTDQNPLFDLEFDIIDWPKPEE